MKKVLILPLIAVLFLSACFLNPEKDVEKTPLTNADEALDAKIFEEAVTSLNIKRCEDISGESKKAECKEVIEAFKTMDMAIVLMDKAECQKIGLKRYRDECELRYEKEFEIEKIREKVGAQQLKDKEKSISAFNSMNYEECSGIENEETKYTCLYNVIANLAIQSSDFTLCEKIERPDLVKSCKENEQK